MFDEEKTKKDLLRMRDAYKKAHKDLKEIETRQKKIAENIYTIRERNKNKRKIWEED